MIVRAYAGLFLALLTTLSLALASTALAAKSKTEKKPAAEAPAPAASPSPAPLAPSGKAADAAEGEGEKLDPAKLQTPVLQRDNDKTKQIVELIWSDEPLRAKPGHTPEGEAILFVSLKGKYDKKLSSLLWNLTPVEVDPDGRFEIKVPVHKTKTPVHLMAIDPKGNIQREEAAIEFSGSPGSNPFKRWMVDAGPAFTTMFYYDFRVGNVFLTAMNVRAAGSFIVFPPNWDAAAKISFTALPITSSFPGGYQVRFLNIDGTAGFRLPMVRTPWSVSIRAGYYFTTMFVWPEDFGFRYMNGPQLHPVASYTFKNGMLLSGYAKYSPMFNGFAFMSLNNCDIGVGAALRIPLKGIHNLQVSLDFDYFNITISTTPIAATSFVLGVAYAL